MSIARAVIDLEIANYGPVYSSVQQVSHTESIWHEMVVATATTDSAVSFGGVTTADVVLISSDQTISYRQAVTDTATTLDANGVHILCRTAITALYLTNASGSSANVKIILIGA